MAKSIHVHCLYKKPVICSSIYAVHVFVDIYAKCINSIIATALKWHGMRLDTLIYWILLHFVHWMTNVLIYVINHNASLSSCFIMMLGSYWKVKLYHCIWMLINIWHLESVSWSITIGWWSWHDAWNKVYTLADLNSGIPISVFMQMNLFFSSLSYYSPVYLPSRKSKGYWRPDFIMAFSGACTELTASPSKTSLSPWTAWIGTWRSNILSKHLNTNSELDLQHSYPRQVMCQDCWLLVLLDKENRSQR